ncbi:PadR family transcriptional regulator [Paenibacillus sp. J31TS4]|uniref:PadR family transcriptional regulator n=1 Tax=Paenibacillus sp. J31TS4 TaxID=2807195 RepID=UPI001B0F3A75|nr:PadR family transcriptional regulator [Paenibacillus sp. J31TS4]GIP37105.1 PadR family transcriptional regulator [Paenibacillus sp. J31TS4]
MADVNETTHGLLQELRRGTIILGVLSQMAEPRYGYSLVPLLEEKGIAVDAGTLYPLLRRLEKQGLLNSEWDTNEARPRKYYVRSPFGQQVYDALRDEWRSMNRSMESLMNEDEGGSNDGAH